MPCTVLHVTERRWVVLMHIHLSFLQGLRKNKFSPNCHGFLPPEASQERTLQKQVVGGLEEALWPHLPHVWI